MSNNSLVGEAFEAMRGPLGAFVMREMIRNYDDDWWSEGVHGHLFEDQRRDIAPLTEPDDTTRIDSLDILMLMRTILESWKDVFSKVMDRRCQSWIRELIDDRNAWAHSTGDGFSDAETDRALDTMNLLMKDVDPQTASAIAEYYREFRQRDAVTAAPLETQPAAPSASVASQAPVAAPDDSGRLRSWRTIAVPQNDVARGRFKTAEFALDLAAIAHGDGGFEYRDPTEFFSRTYITEGMRSLLETALKRVSTTDDDDGDPVVELKTAFGGGKTHSMVALYHLMRMSATAHDLPGVGELMDEAKVPSLPKNVYVATLVGTDLNPAASKNPPFINGKVNTLWGELAYQLCFQKGDPEPYSIIRAADSKGVAPGTDTLKQLFDAIGPCVILVDEFVAYARNLYGADARNLPAGTFENVLSFMQQLTEAVKRTQNCMLVASLPASDREVGGEGGKEALEAVEHVFGRVNSIWRSATKEEGFEIVKKRLFSPYDESLAEPVVDAFMAYYRADPDKFPVECHEASYRDRMLKCYPIHPQTLDRLYEDWSTLEKFQRTRGVLRLMAEVIHNLWQSNDVDPLIMPGSFDFADSKISEEIFQYLDPSWSAVVDTDVDGEDSTPAAIDRESTRFTKPRAARRVARTIFLGSAPTSRGEALRGLDDSDIRLGAALPPTNVTVFDDALFKMRDELSYLYSTGARYWFDTHPTLEKMARDRASRVEDDAVDEAIIDILRKSERGAGSGFGNVYVCPHDGSEVPDDPICSLVIEPPSKTQRADDAGSPARAYAADVLSSRGDSLRANRNMLLFAAADEDDLSLARKDVCRALAWRSISDDADALDLTSHARSDATGKRDAALSRAKRGVIAAYKHLLCPSQGKDDLQTTEWDVLPLPGGDAVSKKAFDRATREEIIVRTYSPYLLQIDLEQTLLADGDFVSVGDVWNDYCRYGYLRRFSDEGVLRSSIVEGVATGEYFAYADGFDGKRFCGLKMKDTPVADMHSGLLVRRERALEQLAFEKDSQASGESGDDVSNYDTHEGPNPGEPVPAPVAPMDTPSIHEVSVEAQLNHLTAGTDVGTIVEEVLQHLYDIPGASTELIFSATVEVPSGIDDRTLSLVRENARTLGITLREGQAGTSR